MGASLEDRRNPVSLMRREAATVMGGPPNYTAAKGSCTDAVKRRRIAESTEFCAQQCHHDAAIRAEGGFFGDCAGAQDAFEVAAHLRPSIESIEEKPKSHRGSLRAVLFDFDATLTSLDGLQAHRLFPNQGRSGGIDVEWLREKGFGGEARILRLGATLQALAASGVELHIVSLADRALIVRALAIIGALHFFCDRIFGWMELAAIAEEFGCRYASKAPFIKSLMEEKKWSSHEVLFVDDQERNLEDVKGLCLTHRTAGCGLTVKELDEIVMRAC